MKIKGGLVLSTVVAIGVVFPGAASGSEDQYNVVVHTVMGPRFDTNSGSTYQTWSTNVVAMLYSNQTLSGEIGYRLTAGDITQQSPALTNNALWFVAQITAKNGHKLALPWLQFAESSNDGNTLANSYVLANVAGLVYGPHAYGVNWSTNGGSNTILPVGSDGTNFVDEVDLIGLQSTYYQYPLTTVSNYLAGFSNFMLTASCSVVSNGTVLARGQKTLQTVGSPTQPSLSIRNDGGQVTVTVGNIATNQTAVIRTGTDLNAPFASGRLEATINSGDVLVRAGTNQPIGFFRAQLE